MKYLVYVPENFTNNVALVKRLKGEDVYINEYELSVIIQFNKYNGLPLTSKVKIPDVGKFYIDKDSEFTVLGDVLIVKVGDKGFYPLSTDGTKEALNTFKPYLCDIDTSMTHLRKNFFRELIN